MSETLDITSAAAGKGPLSLEAVGLSKDFRLGRGNILHAVRDVNISLYKGAVVALVGESGSGKSTVARMLAGQERPTAGTITLNGEPVDVRGGGAFRRYKTEVQYVFQDPFGSLNPVHSVGYHLARPVKLHQGSGIDVKKTVMALLELGSSADIKDVPAHPYTQGLLRSFPSLRGTRRELTGIPGSPPDLRDPKPGCPFIPRCGYATDACVSVDMSLAPVVGSPVVGSTAAGSPAGAHLTACPIVTPAVFSRNGAKEASQEEVAS